jgi:nitrate/TMAO reductase-like tetraheme cytochrome c subunit
MAEAMNLERFLSYSAIALLAVFLSAASAPAQATLPEVCLSCHGVPGLEKARDGKSISLHVDGEAFGQSVHAPLGCTACHGDASAIPHGPELKRVDCSKCHAQAAADFSDSVHGKAYQNGLRDSPGCAGCHGSHDVLRVKDPNSKVYPLNLARTCGSCHGDPDLAKRHRIPVANAYQLYMDSIHGRALTRSGLLVAANCRSCHGAHRILPALDPNSSVHRRNVPATCGQCHAGVLTTFQTSIHGREAKAGNAKAPVCIDCHTSHEIRRVEMEAWQLDIVRECGTCHAEFLRSYRDTFHGQVTSLGFARVARCSDCHGAHDILPVSDPNSSVASARVVETCRKCHLSANASFVKYDPHAEPTNRARNPLLFYTSRFMIGLLASVFVFFGLHTALWAGRALLLKRRKAARPPEDGEPPPAGESSPGEEEKQ